MNSWINPRQSALFSPTSFSGEESLARSKKEQASGNVLRKAVSEVKNKTPHYTFQVRLERVVHSPAREDFVASIAFRVKQHIESTPSAPNFESYTQLLPEQKKALSTLWKSLSSKEREIYCPSGQWKLQTDFTPAHVIVLALSKGHLPAAMALLECFPSASTDDLKSVVEETLNKGFVEGGYYLLSKGLPWPQTASLDKADGIGRTLAWVAARENNALFMKELIDRGADIDVADKYGWTPLLVAANAGHLPVVQELSSQGVNVGAMDVAGWMPLHRACLHGHAPVAKTLIVEMAAQADIPDYLGRTPLHRAVERNRIDIVRFLCEQCEVNLDQEGYVEGYAEPVSCRKLALDRKQSEVCQIFDQYTQR